MLFYNIFEFQQRNHIDKIALRPNLYKLKPTAILLSTTAMLSGNLTLPQRRR